MVKPKRRKRPQVISVTGEKWQRRNFNTPKQVVYSEGAGPTPIKNYIIERFSDIATFDKLKQNGAEGTLMKTTVDFASRYDKVFIEGMGDIHQIIPTQYLKKNNSSCQNGNIPLPKGCFLAGTGAIYVGKHLGRTRFVIDDLNPVLSQMFIFFIDGDLYACENLTNFEHVSDVV